MHLRYNLFEVIVKVVVEAVFATNTLIAVIIGWRWLAFHTNRFRWFDRCLDGRLSRHFVWLNRWSGLRFDPRFHLFFVRLFCFGSNWFCGRHVLRFFDHSLLVNVIITDSCGQNTIIGLRRGGTALWLSGHNRVSAIESQPHGYCD